MLGTDLTRDVLNGSSEDDDRSNALTTAIQEWWGWFNWCFENSVPIHNSVENLAFSAGESLGIDDDRIQRILKTIDPDCEPSAKYRGGNEACWKKVKKLNRSVFNQQCPSPMKELINQENPNGALTKRTLKTNQKLLKVTPKRTALRKFRTGIKVISQSG